MLGGDGEVGNDREVRGIVADSSELDLAAVEGRVPAKQSGKGLFVG